LILAMTERVGQPGMPASSALQNLRSALSALLSERGLNPGTPVGSTLRVSFRRVLDQHVGTMRTHQRSASYIANRKSLLKQWRDLVLMLDRDEATRSGSASPLQMALKAIFAQGANLKGTARQLGIPLASLRRWRAGATPQRGSARYFHRLERFFGMPSGALIDLLPASEQQVEVAPAPPIAYRERMRSAVADPYAMRAQGASIEFKEEWQSLIRFKTDIHGGVLDAEKERFGRKALWRLKPHASNDPPSAKAWIDTVGDQHCQTARINFTSVAQFFGWLMMDAENGGLGMAGREAQTLGQFTNTAHLKGYMDFRIKRSGGIISGACSNVLIFVSMLCHPQHGFLITRPDIARRLDVEEAAWPEQCKEAKTYADRVKRNMKPRMRLSRDPFEPIRSSLELENPLDAIADAIRRLDANRPVTGGMNEAVWARDRLLLALSASNPLRALNLKELSYHPDGTGQLRKDHAGRWRIVIAKEHFKNEAGAAKEREYNQLVQEPVWPMIETYLREYRLMFSPVNNNRVFLSSKRGVGGRAWSSMNRHFETLTRKYLHGCPGTGPHCIRHIVATAIVKRTGNFVAAALVLHDKEDTVRRNYGHLCGDDGARWLSDVLGEAFNRK